MIWIENKLSLTVGRRSQCALNGVDRVLVWSCAICLFIFTGAQLANVLARTYGITWVVAGEISTVAFIWGTFLGASLGVRRDAHLKLSAAEDGFKGTPRVVFMIAGRLGTLIAGLLLLIAGFQLTRIGMNSIMPFLGAPRAIYYSALPVGGLLISLFAIEQLMRVNRKGEPTGIPGPGAAEPSVVVAAEEGVGGFPADGDTNRSRPASRESGS
ncbi:TRAP transporter small permease [Nesterenkonia populi]